MLECVMNGSNLCRYAILEHFHVLNCLYVVKRAIRCRFDGINSFLIAVFSAADTNGDDNNN